MDSTCREVVAEMIAVLGHYERYAQESVPETNPRKIVRLPIDAEWHALLARLSVCVSNKCVERLVELRVQAQLLDSARTKVLLLNSVRSPSEQDRLDRDAARDELDRVRQQVAASTADIRAMLTGAAGQRWWRTTEDQVAWWVKALAALAIAVAAALAGVIGTRLTDSTEPNVPPATGPTVPATTP